MRKFDVLLLFISIASLGAIAPVSTAQIAPAATYSASASNDNSASPATDADARSTDTALPVPGKTQPALDLTYSRPTEQEKLHSYFFDAFGPYPLAGAVVIWSPEPGDEDAAGVGAGDGGVRRASWLRLRHRAGNHDDALRAGGSFPRRHAVLPLRVHGRDAAAGACRDFDGDGAGWRRWTSAFVVPCD